MELINSGQDNEILLSKTLIIGINNDIHNCENESALFNLSRQKRYVQRF